ncbi:MAG: polysaccharide deacetylase family protein [Bacillota bacterium]
MIEQLGFQAKDRVIIINADDFGINHASNQAIMKLFHSRSITSASLMVPCAAMQDAALFCKRNNQADIGIHLTLTSTENDRCKPVFQGYRLDSLVTEDGYFHADPLLVEQLAKPEQVKLELQAQIEMALALGVDVTHLDSHAGSVMGIYTGRDFLEIVFDLCEQFQLPFNLPKEIVNQPFFSKDQKKRFANSISLAESRGIPLIDDQCGLSYHLEAGDNYEDMKKELTAQIVSLKPGLTQIVTHPAITSKELISLTPHFEKREMEYNLFSDPQIIALFQEEQIKLISWKRVRDLQRNMFQNTATK